MKIKKLLLVIIPVFIILILIGGYFLKDKIAKKINIPQHIISGAKKESGPMCLTKDKYKSGKPILSLPFKLEDYDPKYWGMIPFCADPWKSGNIHNAIDFELKKTAKVYASADGVLTSSVYSDVEGAGQALTVRGNGYSIDYSGLKNVRFKIGEKMKKGDYMADVYRTPYGEYHVHLGISINKDPECPVKYMDKEFIDALKIMFPQSYYLRKKEEPCICNCEFLKQ